MLLEWANGGTFWVPRVRGALWLGFASCVFFVQAVAPPINMMPKRPEGSWRGTDLLQWLCRYRLWHLRGGEQVDSTAQERFLVHTPCCPLSILYMTPWLRRWLAANATIEQHNLSETYEDPNVQCLTKSHRQWFQANMSTSANKSTSANDVLGARTAFQLRSRTPCRKSETPVERAKAAGRKSTKCEGVPRMPSRKEADEVNPGHSSCSWYWCRAGVRTIIREALSCCTSRSQKEVGKELACRQGQEVPILYTSRKTRDLPPPTMVMMQNKHATFSSRLHPLTRAIKQDLPHHAPQKEKENCRPAEESGLSGHAQTGSPTMVNHANEGIASAIVKTRSKGCLHHGHNKPRAQFVACVLCPTLTMQQSSFAKFVSSPCGPDSDLRHRG